MVWTVAVIFILLWALGFDQYYTLGGFTYGLGGLTVGLLLLRIIQSHRRPHAAKT